MRIPQIMKQAVFAAAFVLLSLSASQAQDEASDAQQSNPQSPHETIEFVTSELLSKLPGLQSIYDDSPEEFYAGIDAIVAPWIDFDAFYKGVMGRKYFTAAKPEQRQRFKAEFHRSLIQTYGKGLLGVQETRFEVAPSKPPKKEGGSVHVQQTLFSGSGRIAVVYTMGQSDDGRWRLKNVVLEGINLGKTFRNQFARSARENGEDLDAVIDSWADS